MSSRAPFTRTLPYVLREQLSQPLVDLRAAKVTSVPDTRHVIVDLNGTATKVPKLNGYAAAVNDVAQLLVVGSTMLAIGCVK